ncbi:hypothetical protein G6F24_006788 [Rhizopus arrhizus]|nr:hypothetical protein G6F24_006788 [Rhizopus arrhizus]
MPDRRAQFEAVQYRHAQLGVLGAHAAVAGDAGVGVYAQAGKIARPLLEVLMELLLAVFAPQRQAGRTGAEPIADLAADAAIEAADPADRRHVVTVVAGRIDVGLAFRGLRAEGVEQAARQAIDHCLVADVAAGHRTVHLVLVVGGTKVVIPSGDVAVEAQQYPLAGVLVFRLSGTGGGLAPVEVDRLAGIENE